MTFATTSIGGAADLSKVHAIDLERIPDGFRLQLLVFQAARKAFDALQGRFKGGRGTHGGAEPKLIVPCERV